MFTPFRRDVVLVSHFSNQKISPGETDHTGQRRVADMIIMGRKV